MIRLAVLASIFLLAMLAATPLFAAPSAAEVRAAMKKAGEFYRGKIARHSGYVYYTLPDFSKRMGEGVVTESQIWVQPPGTPSVGLAYLKAYQATGDAFYLDAALEAGDALIYGQLQSGAWTNLVDFDPGSDRAGLYRNGKGKGRNTSSLDDGISQAAMLFLIRLDKATNLKHPKIHEAAKVALDALLKAQFPNGAFPQGWDETPVRSGGAIDKQGSYPAYDWRTEGRIKEYWDMYTLNDDLCLSLSETLMEAHLVYQDSRYADSLRRLGQFLVLAQMPEPQRGWAQQYNYEMQPIWARKFEPPAISGRESETALVALMRIAAYFRDKSFLAPIPSGLAYLKKSELPDGTLARYYELQTNKPLYMERRGDVYSLTYDDSRLPSHYGWKNPSRLKTIEAAWNTLSRTGKLPAIEEILPPAEPGPTVEAILKSLDSEGRWVSSFQGEPLVGQPKFQEGDLYINSSVFNRNMETLSGYLMAQ